jgi:hypothetical protein
LLLATKVLVGFLRGPLTNLGTPPVASDIRSILVRPLFFANNEKYPSCSLTFIIRSATGTSSKFVDVHAITTARRSIPARGAASDCRRPARAFRT